MNAAKNIFLIVLLVFFDQLSKYMVRHFDGFYICNKGIAFGLKLYPILFWITWLIIIAIVSFKISNFQFPISNQFSIKKLTNFKLLGLIFILSGAVSNIMDRLYFGCIIDFIDLKFWPIFNLADSFIVVGAILILLHHFKKPASE